MAYVNILLLLTVMSIIKFSIEGSYRAVKNTSSLHSNRDYEIGMVYWIIMDGTTALVSQANTTYVPCSNSALQNKIKVTIPIVQKPPSWAEYYRFVCKANKETYYNVFSNFFYEDTVSGYYWLLLEGENSSKVEKGDKLRVKRDVNGFVSTCNATNFFMDKNDEVWTSTGDYCMNGITRQNIINICKENEKHLLSIRDEMENVRELYVKGYIDKETYQLETRTLFELAVKYGA